MADLMEVFAKAVQANPQAGLELMQHTAYAAVSADVEAMRPIWEAEFARTSNERIARAKVALARSYVAKAVDGTYPDRSSTDMAIWLNDLHGYVTEISKALEFITFNTGGRSRRQQVQRDELGRFSRISGGQSATAGTRVGSERRYDIAQPVRDVMTEVAPAGAVDPASAMQWQPNPAAGITANQIDTFQGHFEAAVDHANDLIGDFNRSREGQAMLPNAQVELTVANSNQRFRTSLTELAAGKLPPGMNPKNPIIGIQAVAGEGMTDAQRASLRRGASPSLTRGLFQRHEINVGTKEAPEMRTVSNLEQLFGPTGDSKTQALIGRLSVAGSIMSQTNAPAALTHMALLVGAYGPEAARVLEPHAKKAAYRYRGTERTPDARITGWFQSDDAKQLDIQADQIDDGDKTANQLAQEMMRDGKDESVAEKSIIKRGMEEHPEAPISGDSLEMAVRSDVVASELVKTIPQNKIVSDLARNAGSQLPSQGIMIDGDGDVVSQAVGFGPDHYLPFNLGNLNRMKGGQYIRTRQQGGLTGEDIYASVLHGARSATVVSTSGVTRIEFAPDFRGARASSDKAFSMYDRYLSILDTVAGSGMYIKDLDAPTMATLELQAKRSTKGNPDPNAYKDTLEQLKADKRDELSQLDEGAIQNLKVEADKTLIDQLTRENVRAPAGTPGDMKWSPRLEARRDEIFNMAATEAREAKVRELNLNAEGYTVALQTLQQQFPYFIRSVEHEPLGGEDGFLKSRGLKESIGPKPSRGSDQGYVRRGATAPYAGGGGGGGGGGALAAQRPAAPAAPAAQATPGAAAPAAGTEPASVPDTTSVAARVSAAKGRASEASRKQAVSTFFANLSRMNRLPAAEKDRGALEPGADVANYADIVGTDADRAQWFLNKNSPDATAKAFADNSGAALELFGRISESDLLMAIQNEYGSNLAEVLAKNEPFGAETPQELVAAIRGQAMNIAEAEALTTPFESPNSPAAKSQTAKPIGFTDIVNLGSLKEVNDYAQAKPELKALADKIGTDAEGRYLSYGAMASRMGKAHAANQALLQARHDWMAGDAAAKAGIKAGFLAQAASGDMKEGLETLGLDAAAIDDQFSATPSTSLFGNYEQLQRARTLVEVARVHGAFGAGDANPKAMTRPPWASGVLKAARSSQPAVRVVSKEHPLSKAVQARRAAGLPLVAPMP